MSKGYTFVERTGVDNWVVRITDGPYRDTFLTYDHIRFVGEDDPVLKFHYTVLESDSDVENLQHDERFIAYIGSILSDIIHESIKQKDFRIGDKPEDE